MKKILLLSVALLISAGLMAQSTESVKFVKSGVKCETVKKHGRIDGNSTKISIPDQTSIQNANTKATQSISKTHIGTSANCFSVLLPEQTVLAANEEIGLIMMTHRANGVDFNSGYIHSAFSTDGGFSFDDSTVMLWENDGNRLGRYPCGVIYNPTGNTTPANAYVVGAGPLNFSDEWIGGFYAYETFGGTNYSFDLTLHSDTTGGASPYNFLPRMYMQTRGNKVFLYGGDNVLNTAETAYTSINTVINIGTWDAGTNSCDWALVSHIPAYVSPVAGNQQGWGSPAMAFNDNASVGYLVYTGRDADASDQLSYIPVIYKSVDNGLSWVKQPAFEWSSCTEIATLVSTLSDVNRPYFGAAKDATFDENGYLHFISYVHGAATNNADSLNYIVTYTGRRGFVFDIFQTATGWDAILVDTVFAKDPEKTTTLIDPGTDDYVTWDERFQMSKTTDGAKIVYAWMDTDPSISAVNLYPDIMVKMYDVTTGIMGPKVNITAGTNYDAMNYWMYLSDITFDKGSYYQVNISTSTLQTTSINPVNHEYITGVYLDETGNLLSSISDLSLDAAISMYPNPTSGDLNLSFNNMASDKYNVVVFNTIGSVVLSQNMDVNGAVVRTINMNELPTGIYMVQVSNKAGTTTKKVIKN